MISNFLLIKQNQVITIKRYIGTFWFVKHLKSTFCRNDTYDDYVTYTPKIENITIKIGYFTYKYKFSTFILVDGYRHKIHRNSIKVIISLDLSASNIKTL